MLKASFGYDGMGRQTVQTDWLGDGATIAYQRTLSDNAKSELTGETMTQRQGTDVATTTVATDYGSGGTRWQRPTACAPPAH